MPPTPQDRKPPRKTAPRKPKPTPASTDKYAATTWGSAEGLTTEDFIVPSGQTCLVRRPGVEQLLLEGVLFETDYLTTLVQENIDLVEKGRPSREITVDELMKDPETFKQVVATVDRIVCAVVVKPPVQRPPNDITLRENGQVYVDTISLVDRFAILEFALGGSRALADFRS